MEKLYPNVQRCDSYNVFKSNMLKFIRLLVIRFLIGIIFSESNIVHKFDLDLVICGSINSNTAFRIYSVLYVTAVMMLKRPFSFSSTVSFIVMNVAHF